MLIYIKYIYTYDEKEGNPAICGITDEFRRHRNEAVKTTTGGLTYTEV